MPDPYTFKLACVRRLLREEMRGQWIDPFAGLYSPAKLRNDADPAVEAEFHQDGLEWLCGLPSVSFDGCLFDPPYSLSQALRKYQPFQNGTAGRTEYWAKCKDEIARIIRMGGKAICFAWNTTGIGETRGFKLQRTLDICHGVAHNDTLITVETKIIDATAQRGLFA